ncbi:MAG: zeta toxin family protein, partial [Deltaproteobacteria bacterium]|nr:zeta toxin family protein [Deltaproteobacteria bacterium]
LIIAGPNGAGKTTFATEFLPREAGCPNFINADLIAAGINPFRPDAGSIQAAKVMLEMMKMYVEKGESFSFETTLSGKNYAGRIPEWQKDGYSVKLYFLKLPDTEIAIARVKQRVKEGGHNVPEDVIRRRFKSGWNNFERLYKNIVDEWALYDNAGGKPILLNEGEKDV